ncbi:MAG: hypothetical protein MPJ24_05790 [Pirellulaceae bacterium]|nr:hypothetical protein [Pirellulaceae bacterium]
MPRQDGFIDRRQLFGLLALVALSLPIGAYYYLTKPPPEKKADLLNVYHRIQTFPEAEERAWHLTNLARKQMSNGYPLLAADSLTSSHKACGEVESLTEKIVLLFELAKTHHRLRYRLDGWREDIQTILNEIQVENVKLGSAVVRNKNLIKVGVVSGDLLRKKEDSLTLLGEVRKEALKVEDLQNRRELLFYLFFAHHHLEQRAEGELLFNDLVKSAQGLDTPQERLDAYLVLGKECHRYVTTSEEETNRQNRGFPEMFFAIARKEFPQFETKEEMVDAMCYYADICFPIEFSGNILELLGQARSVVRGFPEEKQAEFMDKISAVERKHISTWDERSDHRRRGR